jgi:hypothetical protein
VEPVARTLNGCEASKKKQISGEERRQIGIRKPARTGLCIMDSSLYTKPCPFSTEYVMAFLSCDINQESAISIPVAYFNFCFL